MKTMVSPPPPDLRGDLDKIKYWILVGVGGCSHFFSIFLKTFPIIAIQSPRSSEFLTRSEEYLFWKKRLLLSISIFAPLIMADKTDAEMADVSNGGSST